MLDAKIQSNLTLEAIAQRMGTTKSSLSRMLNGSQIPNWKTVAKFAQAIGKKPVVKFTD